MFKDLYRQANDKIDIASPKSRIMERLSKSPAPVRKSYRAVKVAALAACFVLTVAAAGIYENIQKDTELMPGMTEKLSMIDNEAKEVSEVSDVPVQEVSAAPDAAPVAKKSVAPESNPVQPEVKNEVMEKSVESYKTEIPAVLTDCVEKGTEEEAEVQPQAKDRMVSGGGGSSAKRSTELVINDMTENLSVASARFALPVRETKPVPVEEYCEYLGNNIPETAVLPEGVENQTFPVQELPTDDNGEYLEDDFTFWFIGNGKSVQIETTKNTNKILDIIETPDYTKSVVAGNDALVLENNDIFKAYIAPDDVGYSVTTIGCSEAELEALLVSLN